MAVDTTTRQLSDTALEAAALLLVDQGVDDRQVGSFAIVTAARRSGLAPADAAALALEVKVGTKSGFGLRRGDAEELLERATRDPTRGTRRSGHFCHRPGGMPERPGCSWLICWSLDGAANAETHEMMGATSGAIGVVARHGVA